MEQFDTRSLPVTELLAKQKIHSFKPVQTWWFNCLCKSSIHTEFEGQTECASWKEFIRLDKLYESFKGCRQNKYDNQTLTGFWTELQAFLPESTVVNKSHILPRELQQNPSPQPQVVDNNALPDPTPFNVGFIPRQRGRPPNAKPAAPVVKFWLEVTLPSLNECKEHFAKKVPGIEFYWKNGQNVDPDIAALCKPTATNRLLGVSSEQLAGFAWSPQLLFETFPLREKLKTGTFEVYDTEHWHPPDDADNQGYNIARKTQIQQDIKTAMDKALMADKILNH